MSGRAKKKPVQAGKIAYPAIIRKDCGAWFVHFPDLLMTVCDENREEAETSAQAGLRFWLSSGESPPPSTALETSGRLEGGVTNF